MILVSGVIYTLTGVAGFPLMFHLATFSLLELVPAEALGLISIVLLVAELFFALLLLLGLMSGWKPSP
nr:hypothetical protein [Candidatus Njordarchaeota archaeon]